MTRCSDGECMWNCCRVKVVAPRVVLPVTIVSSVVPRFSKSASATLQGGRIMSTVTPNVINYSRCNDDLRNLSSLANGRVDVDGTLDRVGSAACVLRLDARPVGRASQASV